MHWNLKKWISPTGRCGVIFELGRFGMFLGFWFLSVDIVGGFHFEIGK